MTEPTPPHAEGRLSRVTIAFALLGCFVFLYLRTFLLRGTPFIAHDDQILFFVRAERMLHGQIPYRDFFELVTPGIDLLYAAGFRLFGVHAWVMQAWGIALGTGLAWLITLIASRILRGWLVLLPGLLFLVFDFDSALDPTHHWYSTLAALGAVYVLMDGARLGRIFAAGLLCGVATLFTQTQGALTFVALVAYLIWSKRVEDVHDDASESLVAQLAALALPFGLMVTGVLGYYIAKAGVHTVFFDLVVFPVRFLSANDFNSTRAYLRQIPPVHALQDVVRLVPVLFIYVVVPYVYLWGGYELWRKRSMVSPVVLRGVVLLHLVGIALFAAVASGPRFHRLCTVAPPAILICVWLLSQQGMERRAIRNLLWLLGVGFALLLPLNRQLQRHTILNLPIGRTAFTDSLEAQEFQWLAEHTCPADPFFNELSIAIYLSLDNPTASDFVNEDEFSRPEQVAAVVDSLQRRRPRFIVLSPDDASTSDVHSHSAPFRRYVHENYHLARVFPLNHGSRHEELWELN